jgi:excisionase family DNA binding protein
MNNIEPIAYSRAEAAQACRIGVAEIDRAIHSGALKAVRPAGPKGRRYVIPADALKEWLDSRPVV